MAIFNRLFRRQRVAASPTTEVVTQIRLGAEEIGDGDLFEIKIVGESFCQNELQRIAGPKSVDGKNHSCGVTLRCEPSNKYDANAVRVEVTGMLVGHVARDTAARLSPAMQSRCGGAIESRGLIVGGWKDSDSEGHYGIRVWLTSADAVRMGIDPSDIESRPNQDPTIPYPALPARMDGERRLTPRGRDFDAVPTSVTVTHEEHYQPAIAGTRPPDWPHGKWPVLVGLDLALDADRKGGEECIRVHIDGQTLGYLTPAMTKRHAAVVRETLESGLRPTAEAEVRRDQRTDPPTWQLTLHMAMPPGGHGAS
jgi:hypothetical protein